MFFFKKKKNVLKLGKKNPLEEMDIFFDARPWGVFSVSPKDMPLFGAFVEDAVTPEDFYPQNETLLMEIFGTQPDKSGV
ncbi:MAG: hypothetical protein LBF22_12330 [Deltaproteobacteria bacterium]|nr:hypothetical protein [Deltaproteobacteria bacterium]